MVSFIYPWNKQCRCSLNYILGSRNTMYVIIKLVVSCKYALKYISHIGTFYVNSTTKYALNLIPGHERFESRTIFPVLWDTKMLV